MKPITNADRAEFAMTVIDHFCDPFASDVKACLTDLVASALHLAHQAGISPDEIIEAASGRYAHEIAHDPAGEPSQYLAVRIVAMKEVA